MSELPPWVEYLDRRLEPVSRSLERIEQKTTETNGRVTQVEIKQVAMETRENHSSRIIKGIWLACSASATLGILTVTLINVIH